MGGVGMALVTCWIWGVGCGMGDACPFGRAFAPRRDPAAFSVGFYSVRARRPYVTLTIAIIFEQRGSYFTAAN